MSQHVAIMGATGAVGSEFIRILEQRDFPLETLKLLASTRSAGRNLEFRGERIAVEELTERSFEGVGLVLSSAGSSISKQFVPLAVNAGAVVVDNTAAFRMDPDVPLVIPQVNPQDIKLHRGVIANPNCSTIIMNVPVWPLHKANPLRRIVVSTYQAASGAGAEAMDELTEGTRAALDNRPFPPKVLPHPAAFNIFCHDSKIGPDGYNLEESKMVLETHKIFHCEDIRITATCVRVPVMRAHSEAINLQFTDPISEGEVRDILSAAAGVKIVDDREANYFPMPLDASGADDILVGRIRQDISQPDGRGIEMFVCGDQLRKGAALNAVQIAELM
ncbi:MAG: aspartate-semialdehyde dehydrogenase [Phycisphaerae bacterium]|nr:aspartate-semialdehyde dehydrogenase [Phycisphaerae bacterium]